MNNYKNNYTETTVQENTDNNLGIIAFAFGVISIFFLAPLFVPLALLFGMIALFKKQLAWGLASIVCGILGFLTSPILLGMLWLAVTGAGSNISLSDIFQTPSSEQKPAISTLPPAVQDLLQKYAPMLENIGITIDHEKKSLDTSTASQKDTPSTPSTQTTNTSPLLPGFLTAFNEYSAMPEKKAIALAQDSKGRAAWGWGYNYSTQDQANARALSECRSRLSEYRVETECKLYAVGTQVVW